MRCIQKHPYTKKTSIIFDKSQKKRYFCNIFYKQRKSMAQGEASKEGLKLKVRTGVITINWIKLKTYGTL